MQVKPRTRRKLRRPGDLSAHPAVRKHMAAQRRAIKLTPFPKFIDRETGTRCLVALVAAVGSDDLLLQFHSQLFQERISRSVFVAHSSGNSFSMKKRHSA
jgi:hypothetical protein